MTKHHPISGGHIQCIINQYVVFYGVMDRPSVSQSLVAAADNRVTEAEVVVDWYDVVRGRQFVLSK